YSGEHAAHSVKNLDILGSIRRIRARISGFFEECDSFAEESRFPSQHRPILARISRFFEECDSCAEESRFPSQHPAHSWQNLRILRTKNATHWAKSPVVSGSSRSCKELGGATQDRCDPAKNFETVYIRIGYWSHSARMGR